MVGNHFAVPPVATAPAIPATTVATAPTTADPAHTIRRPRRRTSTSSAEGTDPTLPRHGPSPANRPRSSLQRGTPTNPITAPKLAYQHEREFDTTNPYTPPGN